MPQHQQRENEKTKAPSHGPTVLRRCDNGRSAIFSFEAATEGTPLKGARLEIEDVPLTVWCGSCRAERELSNIASRRCPVCNAVAPQVIRGEELELRALEVVQP